MKKKLSILIPDDLHINRKNFPSFFKFAEKVDASLHFEKSRRDWISLYGNHESKLDVLNEKSRVLLQLAPDALFSYSVKGVELFKVARAEILSFVAAEPEWYASAYPDSPRGVFDKLDACNRVVLVQNMAAAWDWIEFWHGRLQDGPVFTHACIFSGSLIYQRALIELLRFTPTRVMLMESSFTGNDYYCEEKYEHIANNCDIRHAAVYRSLRVAEDAWGEERERIKAINKIITAVNKNVTQPADGAPIVFADAGAPVVCLLGQVVNDFSVLEYEGTGLSSIDFYVRLMSALAEAGFNVIFKAHPWEEKKNNVRRPLSRDVIRDFMASLPEERSARMAVVDHYPIHKLFSRSQWVMGLNSQGLFEAAFHGLKPCQFGDAFFGRKGFTHDFRADDIGACIDYMRANPEAGTLSLHEFYSFEVFCTKFFQGKLVSVHDSGLARLAQIFSFPDVIALASGAAPAREGGAVPKPQAKPPTVSAPVKVAATPVAVPAKSTGKAAPPKASLRSEWLRKWRKFLANPRKFFGDSKRPYLRWARVLFSHR